MADPHHVPTLDGFDRLTVTLYRLGLGAAGLLLAAAALLTAVGRPHDTALVGVTAAVALAVADLHLYDKRIRWLVVALGVAGPVALSLAPHLGPAARVGHHAGLGLSFAALSALALKEGFCFRVPGVRLVPLALASSLVPLLGGRPAWAAPLLGLAGLVVLALFAAKLRMPLGHDVGDRSRYQV